MTIVSALLLALPLAALPAQDRVVRTDGSTVSGRLVSAGLDQVVLQGGDGPIEIPAGEVLEVRPGPTDPQVERASSALEANDFDMAVNLLDAAATAAGDDPAWLKPWLELQKGLALLAWARTDPGRSADAVRALGEWADSHPDLWWYPEARLAQARASVLAGDTDGAVALLKDLSDLAFEKGLPKSLEAEINLERSRAFLEAGQTEVAEARLRDLAGRLPATDLPRGVRSRLLRIRDQAQILLGEAVERKGGPDAAATYWQGLLDDPQTHVDVRAAALLGLARGERAAGQLRSAQMRLGHVVAELPAAADVMARALWELGDVTAELGDHPTAARRYWQRLVDRYPGTPWAAKARARLEE